MTQSVESPTLLTSPGLDIIKKTDCWEVFGTFSGGKVGFIFL